MCTVDGCHDTPYAKGLCKLHYKRQMRTGSVHTNRPCLHKPIEEKFWLYVNVGEEDQCWEWEGFKDKDGYGKIRDGNKNRGAHRISWQLHYEGYPAGKSVLHKCNNPACVNPHHLYLGDHNQNMKDRLDSGHYPRNEKHPNVKFPDEIVRQVKTAHGTYKEIGRKYGMSESHVGNIKRGVQRIIDLEELG